MGRNSEKTCQEVEIEMSYSIVIKKSADKELLHLPASYIYKIRAVISSLAENPRPHDCKKLSGSQNEYRIRVGMYRILYTIHDNILTVFVMKIAHRKDVYR